MILQMNLYTIYKKNSYDMQIEKFLKMKETTRNTWLKKYLSISKIINQKT